MGEKGQFHILASICVHSGLQCPLVRVAMLPSSMPEQGRDIFSSAKSGLDLVYLLFCS